MHVDVVAISLVRRAHAVRYVSFVWFESALAFNKEFRREAVTNLVVKNGFNTMRPVDDYTTVNIDFGTPVGSLQAGHLGIGVLFELARIWVKDFCVLSVTHIGTNFQDSQGGNS